MYVVHTYYCTVVRTCGLRPAWLARFLGQYLTVHAVVVGLGGGAELRIADDLRVRLSIHRIGQRGRAVRSSAPSS